MSFSYPSSQRGGQNFANAEPSARSSSNTNLRTSTSTSPLGLPNPTNRSLFGYNQTSSQFSNNTPHTPLFTCTSPRSPLIISGLGTPQNVTQPTNGPSPPIWPYRNTSLHTLRQPASSPAEQRVQSSPDFTGSEQDAAFNSERQDAEYKEAYDNFQHSATPKTFFHTREDSYTNSEKMSDTLSPTEDLKFKTKKELTNGFHNHYVKPGFSPQAAKEEKPHDAEISIDGIISKYETETPQTQIKPRDDLALGTVLVIGGCGFLGHHIVRLLLAEESCLEIHVMSRSPFTNLFPGVKYHIGDISKASNVSLILSQVRPSVVFNTASPHAYDDHEHAYQYFTVNVEGNKHLLAAIKEVGTVKAYVYTSSGPIIAAPGGGYDQATEDADTLAVPVVKTGDPYHLAKALGEKLVLSANDRLGLRTATVRPTALYGEGDAQMIAPVIRVLEAGQTNVWLGYNDTLMDVVYVGHVAEAHNLCAKGLLLGISDPKAPKVDGESFNITDDEPHFPLTFFRKYWALAGDETPLEKIWYVSPKVTMWMAHVAEWWTWGVTFGKKRPLQLKVERMEFVVNTRTYSIQKIRERLGFKPWVNQPFKNQDEAVKGALEWYLLSENHGPINLPIPPSWPQIPFKLITHISPSTTTITTPNKKQHYSHRAAQIMALTHNTFFRALNSIYHLAPLIPPSTQTAEDFLAYCLITHTFIHHHQLTEERFYFPALSVASKTPNLMSPNITQHHAMDTALSTFRNYCETTPKEKYSAERLRQIIDTFAPAFSEHNHEEIATILALEDKIDSVTLQKIEEEMRALAEKNSDIFKIAPFVLGNQDVTSLVDGEKIRFPLVSDLARVFVGKVLASRHQELWRFCPSEFSGVPRVLPGGMLRDEEVVEGVGGRWWEVLLVKIGERWVVLLLVVLVMLLLVWRK